jgi:hypothetical protein
MPSARIFSSGQYPNGMLIYAAIGWDVMMVARVYVEEPHIRMNEHKLI